MNSYLASHGVQDSDRAELLGHSTMTNVEHYTYPNRDYVEKARVVLDEYQGNKAADTKRNQNMKKGTLYTIPFAKRKSPQTLSF